jgi:superfamily I DNA/RNA helicase
MLKLSFTEEQKAILSAEYPFLLVSAFAGTGKTTVLVEYARKRPNSRFLYLVFNEKMAKEAKNKFTSNTECKTLHSIAYREVGYLYKHKLSNKLTNYQIKEILMLDHSQETVDVCKQLNFILNEYCYSNINEIDNFFNTMGFISVKVKTFFKMLWKKITDISNTLPITHDVYFKLYIIRKPKLNYDYILLDEAQDSNKAIVNLVIEQLKYNKQLIMVGDKHQSIYEFRGSYNVFNNIVPTHVLELTHSFRFGQNIADVANNLFNKLTTEIVNVKGSEVINDMVGTIDTEQPFTIITRTNAGVFTRAALMASNNKKIHFIGGSKNYAFNKLLDIFHLYNKENDKIKTAELFKFKNYTELKRFAEHNTDNEIKYLIQLVEKYKNKIPGMIEKIYHAERFNMNDADVVITTAHKSKGLEFNQVMLGNDFPTFLTKDNEIKFENIKKEELNILYVALTRAKNVLQLNKSLKDLVMIKNRVLK